MADSAPEPFVARFSVSKLLVWVALSGAMAAAGLFMALTGGSIFTSMVGGSGVLFFGGMACALAVRLFDRRPQVIIDADGLYVRSHREQRIALRSIKTMRTDEISRDMSKLAIFLFKPAKYPVETRHRRFIWRLNGSGAREFFGDVWIWTTHLDQPLDAIIRAIWAHFPATEAEKRRWAREDATLESDPSDPAA
ncbi:STM3941 family protein [Porphyrobacter sp. YT40]|uniref:STM3941 family protein n=1 Tax=Porphyrobacter sp. YT40 TaxID=2547601 RepID=UPI001141B1F4|nr:STM3941 family protein [Porphyrobacter sp. YT40]QDH33357.1 hypothetical protein E2E27_02800 [Porphyrobacter sp. YT40]